MAEWDPKKAWRYLRLEMEASKHYWRSNLLHAGMAHPNKIADRLLPGLLAIKAVALLDEALSQWLDQAGHKLVAPFREDLNGRIEYLAANMLIADVSPLHGVRKMRNALAHDPDVTCTWDELEKAAARIETALVHFDLATVTKKLEYFGERSAIEASTEPGVAFTRRFAYGVKEDGEIALEVSWIEKTHNAS